MKRTGTCIIALFVILFCVSVGFTHEDQSHTVYVKAPVSIGNIGIQNLVVGISYDTVFKDTEFLQSPEYLSFINGIKIELQGIAMNEILAHPYLTLETIATLTTAIQSKINEMIESRLHARFPDRQIAIPVSISRVEFYSTERSTLSINRSDF